MFLNPLNVVHIFPNTLRASFDPGLGPSKTALQETVGRGSIMVLDSNIDHVLTSLEFSLTRYFLRLHCSHPHASRNTLEKLYAPPRQPSLVLAREANKHGLVIFVFLYHIPLQPSEMNHPVVPFQ